ncbi:DUF4179 domain-containing protein [Virgibacillus doumboii]|uniref:DUF4179 domain-containing protein n=1 Tax=Virgibacillus doumboii TaxID=2697503 RepID=UPI0013DEEE38|nr:DUF4179 domain-containing protein [Virgibacillus doumboii]
MEKWEDQMRKMRNQETPDIVKQRVSETLDALPEKKKYSKLKYASLAAAIALSMLLGASAISPAFAETIKSLPIISTVTSYINDLGMKNGYEKGLSVPVDEQYEINGKKVAFTEVMYDGTDVYLGYLVSPGSLEEQRAALFNMRITVNGKQLGSSPSFKGEQRNDMVYAGRLKIRFIDEELPDQFKLGLHWEGTDAEFQVTKKGNTEVYAIDKSKRNDRMLINYNSVSFTPTATIIKFDEIAQSFSGYMVHYLVKDDTGRILKNTDFRGIGYGELYKDTDGTKKSIMEMSVFVEPLNEKPESLTVIPYLEHENKGSYEKNREQWKGKELKLSQGESGDVVVTDVVRNRDKITVKFETTGTDEYRQGRNLTIRDEDGNYFNPRLEQVGNQNYKKTFEGFPPESPVFLVTREEPDHIYLDDLKITLPIEE